MPLRRLALPALAAASLAVSGCTGFGNYVISAFPSVVTVSSLRGQNRAQEMAQAQCDKVQRKAQLATGAYPDYTFYCVQ